MRPIAFILYQRCDGTPHRDGNTHKQGDSRRARYPRDDLMHHVRPARYSKVQRQFVRQTESPMAGNVPMGAHPEDA